MIPVGFVVECRIQAYRWRPLLNVNNVAGTILIAGYRAMKAICVAAIKEYGGSDQFKPYT